MDIFSQKKVLVRAVLLLFLLNVGCLSLFIWKYTESTKPALFPTPGFRDVSGVLKKELGLTDIQVRQIDVLRETYFRKESDLTSVIRSERDSMNVEMFNKSTDELLVKSLARRIAENEYQMEMLRLDQSRELKLICTPEQLNKFKDLVLQIRDYFRPDNQGKRK